MERKELEAGEIRSIWAAMAWELKYFFRHGRVSDDFREEFSPEDIAVVAIILRRYMEFLCEEYCTAEWEKLLSYAGELESAVNMADISKERRCDLASKAADIQRFFNLRQLN